MLFTNLMDIEQLSLVIILACALILFIIGKPRYDLVSFIALLLATLVGVVPFDKAFTGFSHPAVITVIAIFVISAAVEQTGLLENLGYQLKLQHKVIWKQIALLCLLVCLLSGVINNVGAIALLIPVTLKVARIKNIPRALLLMPLAFSSLLGGLITLIGTPPNIIISQYRQYYRLEPFHFFDFTPVGLVVALCGILFIAIIGWRLIPLRRKEDEETKGKHEIFMIELKVPKHSPLLNKKGAEIVHYQGGKIQLHAIIREEEFHAENLEYFTIKANDDLMLETDKWTLRDLVQEYDLNVISKKEIESETGYSLSEITLLPHSEMVDQRVSKINDNNFFPFIILAVSRSGEKLSGRIKEVKLLPGDVLLIKSSEKMTRENARKYDSLLIEETWIPAIDKRQVGKVLTIFGLGILTVIIGLLRAEIAFMSVAILMVLLNCLPLDKAYRSIQWPIVVLLGTLLPVGEAMETTGLAKLISVGMYEFSKFFPLWVSLYSLIVTSMLLSNLMNNAAVAVVFAPIAATFASFWEASIDPFLMGIAVGASSPFLTPIGHQSNALVFGPGKYRFTDYLIMGLPLSLIVSIVATGVIVLVWPFFPS